MFESRFDATATTDWLPYEPSDAAAWDLRRVVHLHRRAGFAATWAEVERDLADGPEAAINRLLNPPTVSESTTAAGFETMAGTIGDAAVASGNPNRLKAWWLYRMLFSPDPLGERLTLIWHNHFATSNRKVQDLALMRGQNEVLRTHARGPFGELLRETVKHPATLVWLDADSNRQGRPNENLARELLELFTLGIGNYTEADVAEAARALTGWAVVGGQFGFRDARHDTGDKQILGVTGPLDGDELLGLLLEHPATAERIAGRICRLLLGEATASDDECIALADGLRERDLDIVWAVETVLRSERFFAEESLRQRVAGPAEWGVGTLRALELTDPPPSTLLLAEWTTRMAQDLFYPPNVGGWAGGRAWLSSQAVVARANFAAALVDGRLWHPARPPDLWQLVRRHRPTDDLAEAVAWFAELLCGDASADTVQEIATAAGAASQDDRLPAALTILLAHPDSQLA